MFPFPKPKKVGKRVGVRHAGPSLTPCLPQGQPPGDWSTISQELGPGRKAAWPKSKDDLIPALREPTDVNKCHAEPGQKQSLSSKEREQQASDIIRKHDPVVPEIPPIHVRAATRWGPALLTTLEVDGHPVQATVDTGATVTILSEEFYRKLDRHDGDCDTYTVKLSNAEDGSAMTARGGTVVQLRIGSRVLDWEVYVAPTRDDVLLGLDFLRAADVTIHARGGVYVDGQRVKSQLINQALSHLSTPIHLEKAVVLEPETEYVVWGVNEDPRPDQEGILEPSTIMKGIAIAGTLIQMGARIPIRIANFTNRPIKLRSGTLLGDVVEVVPEGDTRPMLGSVRRTGNRPRQLSTATEVPEHLRDLQGRAMQDSHSQTEEDLDGAALASLLTEFADIFAKSDVDVGHFTRLKHRIDTGNARPIRQPPRRTPLGFQTEEERHLQQMLDAGIIRPSQSEWASPVVLVRKKDGGLRWCVDYRRLNDVTEKDAYPLPKIEECLDTLDGAKWFSTLDLQSGYWQVEVDQEDKAKTAFTTKYGLYEYNRMPFGLCNAPGTFQRTMELVMRGLQWRIVLVYLDDVIIVSSTYQEHLGRLREVFQRLREHGLKLKPKKCHLLQREVEFLGHIVNQEGIHTNPKLVSDISARQPPSTKRELQAFLGLCNYYRRFVPHFSHIARPLTKLTGEKEEFAWQLEQQEAFEALKRCLTEAPMLA